MYNKLTARLMACGLPSDIVGNPLRKASRPLNSWSRANRVSIFLIFLLLFFFLSSIFLYFIFFCHDDNTSVDIRTNIPYATNGSSSMDCATRVAFWQTIVFYRVQMFTHSKLVVINNFRFFLLHILKRNTRLSVKEFQILLDFSIYLQNPCVHLIHRASFFN